MSGKRNPKITITITITPDDSAKGVNVEFGGSGKGNASMLELADKIYKAYSDCMEAFAKEKNALVIDPAHTTQN